MFSYLDAAGRTCLLTESKMYEITERTVAALAPCISMCPLVGEINAAAGLPASRATITFGIYGAVARVLANCALDYTRGNRNGGPMTYIALSLLSLAAGRAVLCGLRFKIVARTLEVKSLGVQRN